MRKDHDHDAPMFWCHICSCTSLVWGLCVATGQPETWAPVSGVTCDVWRCDQPLCVTSEGNAATMERCSRSRIIDTVTRTTIPSSGILSYFWCRTIGRWMSGHGQMQTLQTVSMIEVSLAEDQVRVVIYNSYIFVKCIFVKLREREGQRVDLGRSLKGHL